MPVQQDKTLPISYSRAVELIKNLDNCKRDLGNHPVLKSNAGGTFSAAEIANWVQDDEIRGLMFWYCLKENGDFFLAVEPLMIDYHEVDIMLRRPQSEKLLVPKKLLKENLYNRGDLETKLPGYKDAVDFPQGHETSLTVSGWVDKYLASVPSSQTMKFSPYSFFIGFEENKPNHLRDFFLNKKPENLRYFFSYDHTEAPFSFRVILVPVDAGGMNIHKINGEEIIEDDALQYSWPPKT